MKPNVVFVPFKECRVNKFIVYEVFWSEKILCCEEKLSFFTKLTIGPAAGSGDPEPRIIQE